MVLVNVKNEIIYQVFFRWNAEKPLSALLKHPCYKQPKIPIELWGDIGKNKKDQIKL